MRPERITKDYTPPLPPGDNLVSKAVAFCTTPRQRADESAQVVGDDLGRLDGDASGAA